MVIPISSQALAAFALLILPAFMAQAANPFVVEKEATRMEIGLGDTPVATYVWEDEDVPRPYFCQVKSLEGVQVTRNYPTDPVADQDNDDHGTYHPGIWLAFGDINGVDFWRNKGRVRHDGFITEPEDKGRHLTFTVRNIYETQDDEPRTIGEEHCTYTFVSARKGVVMIAQSKFIASSGELNFGDQEEMGFGVRLATPLRVKSGQGTLINSNFARNEAGVWGKEALWCAGAGRSNDLIAGLLVMPGPDNFRKSWFHARDYGLIVANPFGKKAMTGPKDESVAPDHTIVPEGETLDLTFGVYIYDTHWTLGVQHREMYQEYLKFLSAIGDDRG